MEGYALFVDYEWCSGCKSCELACRNEHDIPRGQWGIRVLEDKPWKMDDGSMNWNYIPVPSALCDLCAAVLSRARSPCASSLAKPSAWSLARTKSSRRRWPTRTRP